MRSSAAFCLIIPILGNKKYGPVLAEHDQEALRYPVD